MTDKERYEQIANQYKGTIQLQYNVKPNHGCGNAFDAMYIRPSDAKGLFNELYPDLDPDDLYVEVEINDSDWDDEAGCERAEADQRHHDELLAEIRKRAEEMGIPSCIFRPWWE